MSKVKNSNYFPHDCSARDDQKLLKVRGKFGLEGYAVFWMCLESMSTNGGYIEEDSIGGISLTFGLAKEQLMAQLEYFCEVGLFAKNKRGFHSFRMDSHLLFRKERSESGKRGAESRWKDNSAIAQPLAEPMQSKVKESKVNILSKDNKAFGNANINYLMELFEGKYGYQPTDRKPRQEAWNLIRAIRTVFKEYGKEWSEEKEKLFVEKYFGWITNQEWADEIQTMSTIRRKLPIYKSYLERSINAQK